MVQNNPTTQEFRKMADLISDLSKDYKYRGYDDIAEYLMGIVIELHDAARARETQSINNNVSQKEPR